ncbi:MAG: phosphatase family protein [Solirubrobacterales bacterium]|nr:phosphatase family protein [Solirubrobacterales bacterium]
MRKALFQPRPLLPRGPLDLLLQVVIVLVAYESYRLSRGAIDDPLTAVDALANATWIIELEQALRLDVERAVQRFSESVWGLPEVSSFLYINVQTTVSFTAMAFVYVRHQHAFRFVRNWFILTWGISVVCFVLLPTMPPRLVPGLGLTDSVAVFTGIDPSSRGVSQFYNPYAAVPSLHVGIALIVGLSLARLCRRRPFRVFWGCYPLLVTFLVMATGNHYLFDAVAGAAVVAVAGLIARWVLRWRSSPGDATGPAPAPAVEPSRERLVGSTPA